MGAEVKGFWKSLDLTQKFLSIGVIILMGLNIFFSSYYQAKADTKSIEALQTKVEQYDQVVNRIDRRLFRLEIKLKIPTEYTNGG